MPRPARRSRSLRRVRRRTPGSKTKKYYKRRKTSGVRCGICRKVLQGASSSKKLARTKKHPRRLFAGALCHKCTGELLKLRTRVKNKSLDITDVSIKYKKYLEKML